MDKLTKGVVEFQQNDFESHKELFQNLGREQKPHTLFIGCSDSRIVPNLITNTLPGELFVVRNIGNIVPPFNENTDSFAGTMSAIEYAILQLNVENIVICGHSNCGACNTIYQDENNLKDMPHVQKWLSIIKPVKERVEKQIPNANIYAKEWLTEQMNIVQQMANLLSYPFIREKYVDQKIKIHGWYYIIETGEVYSYNKDTAKFELIAK